MTAILRRLGAAHAARMHEVMVQDPNHPWSVQDWLLHFSEEERFIFPMMVRVGMRAAVERLARDHGIFREQFRRFGNVDRRLLDEHAKFEDQLVLQLEPRVG
jgi:DUF438 domain-containing protein